MRRFFFLLLILLTYYLAGMYRSLPLLILCAAEFLTVIFSFLLTRYFRRKIAASFQKKNDTARAGEDGSLRSYGDVGLQAAGEPLRADGGSRLSAAQRERKREAAAGEPGGVRGKSVFFPDFCSSLRHRPDQTDTNPGVRLFFLFSAKKKTDEEMLLAVFPKEQALQIRSSLSEWTDPGFLQDRTENMQGDARHNRYTYESTAAEIRCGRFTEISAPEAETCGSRNTSGETEGAARVFLDLSEFSAAGPSERDSFYRLLWRS